jgi:unsaturated rhamnogalacturonyl hydrolase
MKKRVSIFLLFVVSIVYASAQTISYAADMAKTVMTIWKDSLSMNGKPAKWSYDQGVFLKGIEGLWNATGDGKYFDYIQKSMDFFVDEKGDIRTYNAGEFTLDNITPGRALLLLYNVTGKEKYLKAVQTLRKQLQDQPRTNEGGFWHKKIYPDQMWLDGLYMAQPFYGEYANTFHEDTIFNDIARQFILMEKNSRDAKTGLLYHGYDESRQQKWADRTTGRSPNFWGRAMGWYGMGLTDALETFPPGSYWYPKRKELIQILNRFAAAVAKVQDKKTGVWWDILDKPGKEKNYLEASASSMFVYALAKGVRLGFLPQTYLSVAKKGYDGIIKNFIKDENLPAGQAGGQTNLHGTVSVSGLGGNPYRDGSYDYYISEKVVVNDPKGVGAFIQAANEMEMLPTLSYGKGKTVLLDYYFNHETRMDEGKAIRFHYIWEEQDNNGFSIFGKVFHKYGVQTRSLEAALTVQNLKGANIYIIVDPDTTSENKNPNYIQPKDIDAIYNWVIGGGVLMLFGNDSPNVEFTHFNRLAAKFGFQFNYDSKNRVLGNQFEMGAIKINSGNPVFTTAGKIYIKEYASQKLTGPAKAVLTQGNNIVVSVIKVGKGTVFAVGDPWFYNEYTDGRKIPKEFENYKAAEDVVKWAIQQSK